MSKNLIGPELQRVIDLIGKLPGLGPRSARRVALHLLKRPDTLLAPLSEALAEAAKAITKCSVCGTFDTIDPCTVCSAPNRDLSTICVVQDVPDLWALERAGAFRGRYHILGGVLSALDGVGPEDLNLERLVRRASEPDVKEVIIALSATVDGQTTAHYISDRLEPLGITITRLAQGVPMGGELDHLDEGTLTAALMSRRGLD
ncbi:recombination mediator RecR [Ponticaulis sp.]|uniref:recombination mediator RecR n=1 Tax=Ponticaulis sp. TaxID=2020902 RepID=UPI000B7056A5|nr:recombination mediator RecR [Ponticaulis sp.]MAI90291.1 recombination protein RecR [Ponticaulis sp.]OUX99933.1 MAG: recombination protein RecR [Hyphomonadaceae bacterium TMED5]|tara:strand:- start:270039 stop:270647 length:609 start_codon:yes stop_codon:yes gene_type:complete